MYPFGSSSASSSYSSFSNNNNRRGDDVVVVVQPRVVGVENYITHNGDFEFFRVKEKYYDVTLVQGWLENVLETPLPCTVDSGEFIL